MYWWLDGFRSGGSKLWVEGGFGFWVGWFCGSRGFGVVVLEERERGRERGRDEDEDGTAKVSRMGDGFRGSGIWDLWGFTVKKENDEEEGGNSRGHA